MRAALLGELAPVMVGGLFGAEFAICLPRFTAS